MIRHAFDVPRSPLWDDHEQVVTYYLPDNTPIQQTHRFSFGDLNNRNTFGIMGWHPQNAPGGGVGDEAFQPRHHVRLPLVQMLGQGLAAGKQPAWQEIRFQSGRPLFAVRLPRKTPHYPVVGQGDVLEGQQRADLRAAELHDRRCYLRRRRGCRPRPDHLGEPQQRSDDHRFGQLLRFKERARPTTRRA